MTVALPSPSVADMDNVFPLPVREPEAPEPLWREVLGEQLRAQRAAGGDRIADVAGRAGISPQYLSELERGIKDPSSEILAAVSGALGLSVPEIVRRTAGRFGAAEAQPRGPVCLAG